MKPRKLFETNEGFPVGSLIVPPNIYFTIYAQGYIVGASQTYVNQSFFLFVLRFPINISAQACSLTQSNVSSLWDRKAFQVLSIWSWKTDWSKDGNNFNCVLARNLKQTEHNRRETEKEKYRRSLAIMKHVFKLFTFKFNEILLLIISKHIWQQITLKTSTLCTPWYTYTA